MMKTSLVDALLVPWRDAVIEECARVCKSIRESWVCGEATTAVGQAYQRACDECERDIKRLSTTPPAPVAPEDRWQPIETAPKDGTRLDLWHEGGRIADCYWQHGAWFYEMGWPVKYMRLKGKTTHWQPLPAPPALASGEGSK